MKTLVNLLIMLRVQCDLLCFHMKYERFLFVTFDLFFFKFLVYYDNQSTCRGIALFFKYY